MHNTYQNTVKLYFTVKYETFRTILLEKRRTQSARLSLNIISLSHLTKSTLINSFLKFH